MPEAGDPFALDRAAVRAAFDRAGSTYENAATLQARVARELASRLAEFGLTPRVVLDLGAGTGLGTADLKRRYRRAAVIALDLAPGMLKAARRHQRPWRRFARVCADALRLPLRDASVDLVHSSLMLQWCEPLEGALAEVRRVLRPEGVFVFSTLGTDTLHELRSAWSEADGYTHVNHFRHVHEIGDALLGCGLAEPVLDVDRLEVRYADALDLMRDLKAIGAHNVTGGRPRGLAGRTRLARVRAAYERFRRAGELPATYEVVYGVSFGGARRRAVAAADGTVRISPADIGRSGT